MTEMGKKKIRPVNMQSSTGDDDPDSFFMSLRPLLVLGQISAVFPLYGTTSSQYQKLRFSWKNWQNLYIGIVFFVTVFIDVCSTIANFADGIHLDNFGPTVFYTVCILNCVFFVEIARGLPELFHHVFLMEQSFKFYGYPPEINKTVKLFLYWFFSLSIIEHGLVTLINIKGAVDYSSSFNTTFLESFYICRFPVLLNFTGHNDFLLVFIFVVNVICTFNWNYLDYFLVCVCMEISAKFAQIVKSLDPKVQPKNSRFWDKVAEDFNQLSVTTKIISGKISKLVFMSYVSNLYHISLQLLRSIKFYGDAYAKTYFYFSMVYLIARMLMVSVHAARIPDKSAESKNILFNLKKPTGGAKRFLFQVLTDDISITGLKFFTVNRKFIVTLVGTLITYEVILLQLNSLQYQDTVK